MILPTDRVSLKVLVTGFALFLAAGCVLMVGGVLYFTMASRIELATTGRLSALAGDIAYELDEALRGRSHDIMLTASLPALRRADLKPERRYILDTLKHHEGDYAWIGIADPDGTIEVATGNLLIGASVKGRNWFEEGRKGMFLGDLHQAILLGNLLPPSADGKLLRLLDIASPVRDAEGRLLGVLCAHLNWQMIQRVADEFIVRRGSHLGYEVMVVGRDNTVLYGPQGIEGSRLAEDFLGEADVRRWADGHEYLTASVKIKNEQFFGALGWRVVARQPQALAYADLREVTWRIVWVGVFGFAFFALASVRIANWLVKPMADIAGAADQAVHIGATLPHLQGSDRYREASYLISSLNTLFGYIRYAHAELERMHAALEGEVAERTAQLRQAQALLVDAVESVRDAFCVFDKDDRVVMCNSHYRVWVPDTRPGQRYEDLLMKSAGRLFLPEDASETIESFSQRRLAYRAAPQGAFSALTDRNRHVQIVDRRTSAGGIVSVIHDVTDEFEREAELLKAMRAAEQANAAKSEFLSRMSHELRTPLNAILGYGQVLQLNPREPLQPKQTEAVAQILSAGAHLLRLINEVLDLARIESGKLDLKIEDVALHDVAAECLNLVEEMAASRQIDLALAGELPVVILRADALRVRQVLINLAANAVKYCHAGDQVRLAWRKANGRCRIEVEDNGPGIAPELAGELFVPFSRLGSQHTATEGTGIGLAISRRLVEAMSGAIGHEPTPGGGATFWIELPLANARTTVGAGGTAVAAIDHVIETAAAKGCVVYVEDNSANIALMQSVFELLPGVSLLVFDNAEDGLENIRAKRPRLVLMDINLPGMNGFEALERLQADPATRDIPVVAVSAAATANDIQRGRAAGFVGYVSKPFNVSEILRTINKLLQPSGKENDDAAC